MSFAPELRWLATPPVPAVELVGGKVEQLCRLAPRYPVPPGFCLTTAAFQRWGRSPLAGADAAALRQCVATAYGQLAQVCGDPQPAVAVRSSAVGEDGAEASFAGQYQTRLNVVGIEAVLAAVQDCWRASAPPAHYRPGGVATPALPLALLVQQLVAADLAAVVFSADPTDKNPDEVVINASWGLGEGLVSGLVTPDSYHLDKGSLALRTEVIAEKATMTVRCPQGGGTRQVTTPTLLRRRTVLAPRQLRELGGLARDLEAHLGYPVDLECAYRGEDLYLLQCRPITALNP